MFQTIQHDIAEKTTSNFDTAINSKASSHQIRKCIIYFSLVSLWISFTFQDIHSYDDLSLIFPFWLLPRDNFLSFIFSYFAVRGKIFASTVILIALAYLGILYLLKLKEEKFYLDRKELEKFFDNSVKRYTPTNYQSDEAKNEIEAAKDAYKDAYQFIWNKFEPIKTIITIFEILPPYFLLIAAYYKALPLLQSSLIQHGITEGFFGKLGEVFLLFFQ